MMTANWVNQPRDNENILVQNSNIRKLLNICQQALVRNCVPATQHHFFKSILLILLNLNYVSNV